MAIQTSDPAQLRGATAYGSDGDKLGKVEEVFLDDATGRPEWAAIKTGLFGGNASLVPLQEADFDGSDLRVPYTKDALKSAPSHDVDQPLSVDDEAELYRHYGLAYSDEPSPTGMAEAPVAIERTERTEGVMPEGRDTSGPTTDDAMTRSEERLRVGAGREEIGRARLRKYITTENVTETVPVRREEVVVEREPVTEANRGAALDGPELSEEEHEVTLHAERPVVEKEVTPVERVRMGTRTETGEETVSAELRAEQIEVDEGTRGGKKRD
jgi:uncharacterized protein (TIGR02271 family)